MVSSSHILQVGDLSESDLQRLKDIYEGVVELGEHVGFDRDAPTRCIVCGFEGNPDDLNRKGVCMWCHLEHKDQ